MMEMVRRLGTALGNLTVVRRRWFSFSLRTFVVILPLLAAVALFKYSKPIRRAAQINHHNAITRKCVDIIEGSGGKVELLRFNERLGWRWHREVVMIQSISFSSVGFLSEKKVPRARIPRSDQLFKAMRDVPDLYRLDVTLTDFCNDDMQQLEGAHISSLQADQSLLTDDPITGNCPSELISVYVDKTGVGDSFVRWMSSQGNIVFVTLSDTMITDESVQSLEQNKRLKSVTVRNTGLSPEAIASLRKRGLLRFPGSH